MTPSRFFLFQRLAAVLLLTLACSGAWNDRADASPAYQAVYANINPYLSGANMTGSNGGMKQLMQAASASCSSQILTSPFCGPSSSQQSISGIFLVIPWCGFEFYTASSAPASCHYTVDSSGIEQKSLNAQSSCRTGTQRYDNCPGQQGTLGQALTLITTINANRATSLGPVKLAVALEAGIMTPLTYLQLPTSTGNGYVDLPLGANGGVECGRLPYVFGTPYVNAYAAALGKLLSYIDTFSSGSNSLAGTITIVTPNPVSAVTAEFDMGGRDVSVAQVLDGKVTPNNGPQITNQGALLNCPQPDPNTNLTEVGAKVWADAFSNRPSQYPVCVSSSPLAGNVECAFGGAVGAARAFINPQSGTKDFTSALIAFNVNTSSQLPDINCGAADNQTCIVDNQGEQWTTYYFYQYVQHLISNTGVAGAAANMAYSNAGGLTGTPTITAAQFALAWTGLEYDPNATNLFTDASNTQTNALNQIPCGLNNVLTQTQNQSPSDREPVLVMSESATQPPVATDFAPLLGVGTVIGWQTQVGQGADCANSYGQVKQYDQIMNSGDSMNSGQFIEIQPDAAFADISACSASLARATNALVNNSSAGSLCTYPSGD